jgi:hypothetical protein
MPNADGPAGLFTEQKKQNEGEKEKRKRERKRKRRKTVSFSKNFLFLRVFFILFEQ